MFKYLWIVVIAALYLWWLFKAILGFVGVFMFHKKFKFDYLPDVTAWYIFVHGIAILAWSLTKFFFYYWY